MRRPLSPRLAAAALCMFGLAASRAAEAQTPAQPPAEPSAAFEFNLTGYVQLDAHAWPGWDTSPGTGRLRPERYELRRARPGVQGRFKQMAFELSVDPFDNDNIFVRDAYVETRLRRRLRLRIGQFKLPGGAEYARSAANLEFLERSALAQWVSPGRDIGAALLGRLPGNVAYEAGVFAGDANGRNSRSGLTGAGRLEWSGRRDVTIGSSLTVGKLSAVDADPANGLEARSPAGYRFFDRVYVDGMRVRTGADLAWTPGAWQLRAEWLRARDQRKGQGLDLEDLPSVVSVGWSASLTRQFGRGGNRRGGWRDWEVGVRAEGLSFDDAGASTGRDSVRLRATDIRRRGGQSATASLAWAPNRWTRWLATSGVERFPEARSAPNEGKSAPYWVAGLRLQFALP